MILGLLLNSDYPDPTLEIPDLGIILRRGVLEEFEVTDATDTIAEIAASCDLLPLLVDSGTTSYTDGKSSIVVFDDGVEVNEASAEAFLNELIIPDTYTAPPSEPSAENSAVDIAYTGNQITSITEYTDGSRTVLKCVADTFVYTGNRLDSYVNNFYVSGVLDTQEQVTLTYTGPRLTSVDYVPI